MKKPVQEIIDAVLSSPTVQSCIINVPKWVEEKWSAPVYPPVYPPAPRDEKSEKSLHERILRDLCNSSPKEINNPQVSYVAYHDLDTKELVRHLYCVDIPGAIKKTINIKIDKTKHTLSINFKKNILDLKEEGYYVVIGDEINISLARGAGYDNIFTDYVDGQLRINAPHIAEKVGDDIITIVLE